MPDYKRLVRKKATKGKVDQARPEPKKFLNRLLFTLILFGLIAAFILGGGALLINFPIFEIKEVSIQDSKGKPVTNPEDFLRQDPNRDFNLLKFDMKKVAQDIQARHPEVADVFMRKQFPHRLSIIIKERIPVAMIVGPESYLVDEEAFILPRKSEYMDLPKITGVLSSQIQLYTKTLSSRVKSALDLLKELKQAQVYPEYKVSRIDLGQYSGMTFYLDNGTEVRIGKSDLRRKAILLSSILAKLKTKRSVPKYIDMRFEDPVVKH